MEHVEPKQRKFFPLFSKLLSSRQSRVTVTQNVTNQIKLTDTEYNNMNSYNWRIAYSKFLRYFRNVTHQQFQNNKLKQ